MSKIGRPQRIVKVKPSRAPRRAPQPEREPARREPAKREPEREPSTPKR